MEQVHKYFCEDCSIYVFGATEARLAVNLNGHNHTHHPTYSDMWTAVSIVRSRHYFKTEFEAPERKALPEYTIPHGTKEWGSASRAPEITDQDRAMLAAGWVKW